MSAVEIASLSSKGQIVIPNSIRNELNVGAGSKFAVISDGRNILLKPIERPKKEEFDSLVRKSRSFARSSGLKKSDLTRAIEKVRRGRRR
ncbi:MAG: AbrB/MazE/SpoVT family DNA-binding domain-containing protein [Chitinivibrionales bacterium]|nr:AbrB/MazE/SpoVT family DNA-binding domain-containing protein [Chitinivibrionales bacterium]